MKEESNNDSILRYADRTDKSFGLAGMAISLMVWDAESHLNFLDIDAPAEEAVRMTADFYLSPMASAKAVWEQNLHRFQLSSAMLVANVACRQFVYNRRPVIPADIDSYMRQTIIDEGASLCQLEAEESLQVYSKAFSYCHRLFTHPQVAGLAAELSTRIANKGKLSSHEVFEILAPLNHL